TTSFPSMKRDISGIFVKRLVDALVGNAKLHVLLPCGARPLEADVGDYPVACFRYAPRSWQRLAHEPGGIPVALERQPMFWLLVPAFLLSMFFAVLRWGRRVDVIHANWLITGLVCSLAGRLLRRPVLTTLRGADIAKLETSTLNRFMVRLTLGLNAQLITVSEPMRQSLQRVFPKYK